MSRTTVDPDFERMVRGYGLTTAEITYRMPDYKRLLQTFVWQTYDMYPDFPRLHLFLAFWEKTLDGPLHSVRLAHERLIRPTEIPVVNGVLLLN